MSTLVCITLMIDALFCAVGSLNPKLEVITAPISSAEPISQLVLIKDPARPDATLVATVTSAGYTVYDVEQDWKVASDVRFTEKRESIGTRYRPIDLDGDGKLEFLSRGGLSARSVTVLNERGEPKWAVSPKGMLILRLVEPYDDGNDGTHSILVTDQNEDLVCRLSHDGTVVGIETWDRMPLDSLQYHIGDVNKDGAKEFVYSKGGSLIARSITTGKVILDFKTSCPPAGYISVIFYYPHLQKDPRATVYELQTTTRDGKRHDSLITISPDRDTNLPKVVECTEITKKQVDDLDELFSWQPVSFVGVSDAQYRVRSLYSSETGLPGWISVIEVRHGGKRVLRKEVATKEPLPWEVTAPSLVIGPPNQRRLLCAWGKDLYIVQAVQASTQLPKPDKPSSSDSK